jgi:hypothetical protein
MKQKASNKVVTATRSLVSQSVTFHDDNNLATVHVFGDVVDDEGCCHIESRKFLWWTPEEELEIGRAYEAVVYLMEKGKHTDEDDDSFDSGRGLEKRTEEGAWKLYETQRDFRNAVLCEQDRWKGRGVTDVGAIAVQLANACKDLSAASLDCAHQMARKDAKAVEAYLRCQNVGSSSSRRPSKTLDIPDGTKTSPLKSAASKRVVPWGRHVSMPLTDTIERKALKASVEDKPIEKEAMTLAAKSALDSRLVPDSNPTTVSDAVVSPKKKKKKCSTKAATADAKSDDKVKKVKKIKKKMKTAVEKTDDQEDASSATKDTTDLEDEIRSLEKEVTKKEAAKKESEKLRLLAKKMSFGFDEETAAKVERKHSSKEASLPATLQEASPPPSRQTSVKKTKTSKRKIKKILGSSLSDLNNASCDFSTAPPVLESSTSSFEHDDEVIIKETAKLGDTVTGHRKQLSSLFPRVFRKKLGGRNRDAVQEVSCHF